MYMYILFFFGRDSLGNFNTQTFTEIDQQKGGELLTWGVTWVKHRHIPPMWDWFISHILTSESSYRLYL